MSYVLPLGITRLVRIFLLSRINLSDFVFREMIFLYGGDCFLYAFFFDLLR